MKTDSKNDGNDAEAICEAVSRPAMRFVPVKSAEQQAVLSLHRIRSAAFAERTAQINQMRDDAESFQPVRQPPSLARTVATGDTAFSMSLGGQVH